ncbi:hypothetical protein NliqN6_1294 [Naganishia liquefaciens]|uniref:Cytochrome b5 heme-binding domain-containing protein n=1 Tax=Naganishia liquefaciens TaxID=104408 RepID=A0A8H3TPM4_9TREE|nr:hypothetical protein NliqN6_1294 [Naganishia liquefaciens]
MSFAIPRLPFWSTKRTEEAEENTTKDASRKTQSPGTAEDDIDAPPSFPMLDSAQRSQAPRLSLQTRPPPELDFDVVPPSPSSSDRTASPPTRHQDSFSAAPSLQTPPTTTKKPNPAIKKRQKVALAPGCSPLDWARVKSSGDPKLRAGHMIPIRVTLDELKRHNTPEDAWSAFNGKVYNITEYLRFHPGGEKELMRCAGRDGTKLFMLTHAWVNVDYMLDTCMIGFLTPG